MLESTRSDYPQQAIIQYEQEHVNMSNWHMQNVLSKVYYYQTITKLTVCMNVLISIFNLKLRTVYTYYMYASACKGTYLFQPAGENLEQQF